MDATPAGLGQDKTMDADTADRRSLRRHKLFASGLLVLMALRLRGQFRPAGRACGAI